MKLTIVEYPDKRLKENIVYESDLGLNFISRLKPASFNYAGIIYNCKIFASYVFKQAQCFHWR